MANAIAFAVPLWKTLQVIDVHGPSGSGRGRPLSHEQRQKQHCAFLGAASLLSRRQQPDGIVIG
jgi:hypothetical protein